jgi:hypothetical protein|tara:strand:- start:40 stop:270 length:231 start_codon:yes stop_codon:yes gene_type:complete
MYNPRFLKVEGHSYLVRDTKTNAIINNDKKGHEQYLALKRAKSNELDKVQTLESQVRELKSDIGDIKTMLGQLLDK